jgi:hypothetical protein
MVLGKNAALTGGLALAIAAATVLVCGCQSASRPPAVTVVAVGPDAPVGLIGHGAIDGKPWRFRLMPSASGGLWCQETARFAEDCASGFTYVWTEKWADNRPLLVVNLGQTIYAQVRPAVAWVSARLSDGAVLGLRPVGAYGRRWIALVLPDQLSVSELTAYSARGEIAHSVPFMHGLNSGPEFVSWLSPGDPGPARLTRLLDPSVVPGQWLYVGPWGNILMQGPGAEYSWAVGEPTFGVREDVPGYPMTPRLVVITYRPDVAYLVLRMSNGANERVPAVRGAGLVFAAFRVARHPAIVSWGAYDSAGRRVSGGPSSPDSRACPRAFCGAVG